MIIETKRNIGERMYKVQGGKIDFFDIEAIKAQTSGENVLIQYRLRVNLSTGYRTEVYEEDLANYYNTPEEAINAVLASFTPPANN